MTYSKHDVDVQSGNFGGADVVFDGGALTRPLRPIPDQREPNDGAAPFDPWHPDDLVRFLRTWGQLSDQRSEVCGEHVREAMDIPRDAATSALNRLTALRLLERRGFPARVGDGPLTTSLLLTRSGTLVALYGRLPRA